MQWAITEKEFINSRFSVVNIKATTYISNLCQPQKVSNKVTFLTEQWCSKLQQRKNQLAQKSDMVNFKATLVFLTF